MTLHEKLKKDMITAMKAKEEVRLQTLRSAIAGCTSALIEKKQKPDAMLEDEGVLEVLRRGVKQRKESATQYEQAGETERAQKEQEEQAVLEEYLPQMLSEEEVREKVIALQKETGHTEKGPLMKAAMQALKGKAEGVVVAAVVGDILN